MANANVPTKTKSFITTYKPIAGYKAVMFWWNEEDPKLGGFWEPWQTGLCGYATKQEAVAEAKAWAEAEGIEYKESQE